MGKQQSSQQSITQHPWQALTLFVVYRICLAIVLMVLYFLNHRWQIGYYYPPLYLWVVLIYLGINLVSIILLVWRKPRFSQQVFCYVVIDIMALTILLHASNSLINDLGFLINISIVGGSLLSNKNRLPLAYAALGTIALFIEHTVSTYVGHYFLGGYVHMGILGLTFFATAILGIVLSSRLRTTQLLAIQRGSDLAKLEKLNALIISKLQVGILVLDAKEQVQLMNLTAKQCLQYTDVQAQQQVNVALKTLSIYLYQQFKAWQADHSHITPMLQLQEKGEHYIVKFQALTSEKDNSTLIFIEDSARTVQQAQQIKLASLGRLTASIAHEIRNPLSAIHHAAQLLAESSTLNEEDIRFIAMITNNIKRMDQIVQNVLRLSKRHNTQAVEVILKNWLTHFIQEFSLAYECKPDIALCVVPPDLKIYFDTIQLHQVLTNLCENGLRYSRENVGRDCLRIEAGILPVSQYVYVDIIDEGLGIADELSSQVFEPFFTTSRSGTGLGLYVARELCEANSARLEWMNAKTGGACFRITFVSMLSERES